MSTIKQIIILIALLIFLGFMYSIQSVLSPDVITNPDTDISPVACTMDAMMCPDGTYVGRSGKNCEFVCPTPSASGGTTTLYEEFTLGLDQSKVIGPLTITPIKIEQDSRCPSDVQCIQAGTVELSTKLFQQGLIDSVRVLKLGESTVIGNLEITLKDVTPYPIAGQKPSWQQYRFEMSARGK